jgi:hypothetical protein
MIRWLRRLFRGPDKDDPLFGVKRTRDTPLKLPVDDHPTEALGLELRLANTRWVTRKRDMHHRTRRVRRITILAALGLLTSVGVARAADSLGVNIPIIGSLGESGIRHTPSSPEPREPDIHYPRTLPGIAQTRGSASEPLEVPIDETLGTIVGRTYLHSSGAVCFAWTVRDRAGLFFGNVHSGPCWPLADILQPISTDTLPHLPPVITQNLTSIVMIWYVPSTVTAVALNGPYGALHVEVGDPWTPDEMRSPRFRTVVGVRTLEDDWHALDKRSRQKAVEIANYRITVRLEDGRTWRPRFERDQILDASFLAITRGK